MSLSLPIDFENSMKTLLGQEWEDFKVCYENDKYQALRLNTVKLKALDYNLIKEEFGLTNQVPWETRGFYYEEDKRPGKHPFHEMGLYYIQEPSAMSAASLLRPEPGMKVLDLCAAPGGKSTQLASYMEDKGLLVANEINTSRAKILSSNIERMGLKNTIVTNEDSFKLASAFVSFFDEILVDAPCSGEGMFRKNPDAMDEWSLDNVKLCAKRQGEILDNAAIMLKPGGKLVYSTCTFAVEENERTIQDFLERHEDFNMEPTAAPWFEKPLEAYSSLEGAFRLWPHKLKGEGHFAAALRKKGSLDPEAGARKKSTDFMPLEKGQRQLVEDFLKSTVASSFSRFILEGQLVLLKDQVYRIPEAAPSLKGIHFLRCGLHLGEIKKNRFEPAHALALSMAIEDAKNCINLELDSRECYGFFNGESIILQDKADIKGWCLVCVEGYSAGWSKATNGQFKNHYPKGLRKDLHN